MVQASVNGKYKPESGRSRICVCRHRSDAARLDHFCVFFSPIADVAGGNLGAGTGPECGLFQLNLLKYD